MSSSPDISHQYKVTISNSQILKMMLPISFAILVPQINFITNNIFLGHLSEKSLAIAGITGVYYLIFAVIGNGLNNGLQVLIARRSGEGKLHEIGKLFSQSIRISLVCSFIGILLTWFIAPLILKFSIHSEEVRIQAISFIKIRIWGLPFLYIYQMRNAVLVGTNQSKYLVYGALAETGINILFDYGFIFGHFGLPLMGFNGAAVSSIIAEASGLLVIFLVINAKGISKQLELYRHFGFDAQTTRLVITQSTPLVFQFAISIITWEYFYILIEHHGQQALAISNTMRNLFGIFGSFVWAFAATTSAMVSNIIGQGKKEEVIGLINKISRLSFGFTLIAMTFLNFFPHVFLSIYGQDEAFMRAAVPVVRVISLAMSFMSVGTIWLNAVTGTGNSKVNLAIEMFTIIFYSIYVYLVLEYFNLSIIYGWMSEWLYWIFTFIPAFLYIKSGWWKKKVI
jgi:multidrug resistance protein, MATE family